jgi:hypothetical protein
VIPDTFPESWNLRPSKRIRLRPVTRRALRRMQLGSLPLGPPTNAEKRDAILILRDGPVTEHPADDPLYREAERILHESG